MKLKIPFVFCTILLLSWGFVNSLFALTLTDTTQFNATGTISAEDLTSYGRGTVNKIDGFGDFVAWAHHYTFDPPATTINSASLVLSFQDDEGDKWWNPLTWEVGAGAAESWQWDIGDIDTGSYVYDVNVDYVGDGSFAIWIGSLGGDFYIVSSVLTIDYDADESAPAPVPEPATMLLFGTGLVGLAGATRKKLPKRK